MTGYFLGWPNLTPAAVNGHIQVTSETTKGHLSQQRHGLHSTKSIVEPPTNVKTNKVYIAMEMQPGKLYTDQTGQLPFTSHWGNAYDVIFYVYNAYAIIAEPIKNGSHTDLYERIQNGIPSSKHKDTNYSSTKQTAKHHQYLKLSLPHKTHIYNAHHLTCTNRMLLKKQFKHGRTISLLT